MGQNFSPRRPPPITKPEEDRSFPRAIYLRTMRATKFVTLAFAGALLALSLVSKATAQDAPPGSLLITAEGRALAPYDMISLDIDIEVKVMNDIERATSAPLAQSEHSQASEALLKTLNEDLGFPYKNVSTGSKSLANHKLDGRSIQNHRVPIDQHKHARSQPRFRCGRH